MKNIITGAGSIMNIAPPKRKPSGLKRTFYRPAASPREALENDWEKVGITIQNVIQSKRFLDGEKE